MWMFEQIPFMRNNYLIYIYNIIKSWIQRVLSYNNLEARVNQLLIDIKYVDIYISSL